jgi:hypothetical protein
MISPYWTVGLFLHMGTSPRTLTFFHERLLTTSTHTMKAFVREGHWDITNHYVQYNDSNDKFGRYIIFMAYDLVVVVWQK